MAAAPLPPVSPDPRAPTPAPLSQGARIIDTFIAPKKTFADIRRSAQWWLPFLVMAIVGCSLVYVAEQKIGTQKLVENDLHARPKAEERFEKLPEDQQATQVRISGYVYYIAIPVFTLIIWLIMAGLQFATLKVAASSDISYGKTLAVIVYAGLPMVLRHALGIVSIVAGVNPDGFTLNNPVASNPGYFMNPADSPFLYFVLSQVDLFLIWTLVLTAIGFAVTGKVKTGTAFAVVFGWWIVITLGMAALFA
jgi:hypothetical protein